MSQLTLSIQYAKNTGLVYNSTELRNLYFTGVDFQDQFGNQIPEETINFYIEAAQKEVQDELQIKLTRQAVYETKDFISEDWRQYGYIPVNYPCVAPISLQGFLNTTLQIDYNVQHLSAKRGSDPDLYWRSINLVPISGPSSSMVGSNVYIGISPYMGTFGRQIPNYWAAKYMTGYLNVPKDILNFIGKRAAIDLSVMIQDILFGVGVASKSISVDGLSESIGTTSSAMYGLLSARINEYKKDIELSRLKLKSRYTSITFGVL